jgi:hypothetical protein
MEDNMESKITKDLLKIHESMLRAQLNVIKQFRKSEGLDSDEKPKEKRMSQMDIVYDILLVAKHPMHVNDIISIAKKRFDIQLDKESLVSALAKRVKRQDRFVKTAPNTFSLIANHLEGG